MPGQDGFKRDRSYLVVFHNYTAIHNQRLDAARCAEQQGGKAVFGPAVPNVAQVEQGDVGSFPWLQAPDIVAAEATCAFDGRHPQRLAYAERRCAVCEPVQQQGLTRLRQHVRTVVRRAAIHTEADRATGPPQPDHGCDPRPQTHVRTRAMGNANARTAQPVDLAVVEINAVRKPRIAAKPSGVAQQIQGALAETSQTIRLFISGLGKVRVKTDLIALGQGGRSEHQLRGYGEWRAWRQSDPQHGAGRGIVVLPNQPLAVG